MFPSMMDFWGFSCVGLTHALLCVGAYFFVFRLGWVWSQTNWLILWPTLDIGLRLSMALACHSHCVWSNPGFAPKMVTTDEKSMVCKKCSAVRLKHTHHCSTCNHCVVRMDHHCPWIANCVGINNQRAFLLFLFYTASAAIESLLFVVLRLITCPAVGHSFVLLGLRFLLGSERVAELLLAEESAVPTEATCDLTIEYAAWGVVACILALIFAIFTSFIAVDQLQNIAANQSTVELLKGEQGPKRTLREAALAVMGSEPSLWWLCPARSS